MTWLNNSRIIAVYAVILLHVSGAVVLGNEVGTEYWWFGNVYDSATRWCIPVFVMISGALLLDPNKQENLSTFYTKRLSRILIPILCWSAFFLLWAFLTGIVTGNELTIIQLLTRLLSGLPHYHMWFLYMILSLYLFTPFFRKIVAHSNKKEFVFLIATTFVIAAINYAYSEFSSAGYTLFITWFLSYVPYYFLGYYIRQDDRNLSKVILWGVFLISIILTFIGCYIVAINYGLEMGEYFYGDMSVTSIPMSISLMYILKSWNKPIFNTAFTKRLSMLTLGIYLVHPVILESIDYYTEYGVNDFNPIISIPMVTFVVSAVSTGIVYVMYKTPYVRRAI